jgi:hypothetical protein
MDVVFGISLDAVAIAALGFGLLAVAGLAYYAWRNRIPPQ